MTVCGSRLRVVRNNQSFVVSSPVPDVEVHNKYESLAAASDSCAEDPPLGSHPLAGVKREKPFGR